MKSSMRLSITLCVAGIAGMAAAPVPAEEISNDWHFGATIYGWLPDIGGHTEFAFGGGGTINVDVSTILDHLKMTGQGSFEMHKGHWGAFTDIVYLNVGEANSQTRHLSIGNVELPGTVTAATDFGLESTIWTVAATYRVTATASSNFDILAGARLAHMKQSLDWTFTGDFGPVPPPPLTGSHSDSVDQWDGIVGGKGRFTFGPGGRWAVPYHFDIGAGDSDLTWQGELGLTYSFGWGDLGVAWRYLDYDLKSGPVKDMNFNGPAVGVAFRW